MPPKKKTRFNPKEQIQIIDKNKPVAKKKRLTEKKIPKQQPLKAPIKLAVPSETRIIRKVEPRRRRRYTYDDDDDDNLELIDTSRPRPKKNSKLEQYISERPSLNIPVRPVVPQNILSAEQYDLLREKLENKEKEKKTDSKIGTLTTQNQLTTQEQQQLKQQIQAQQQLQQQLQQQMQSQMQSQMQLQQQLQQQIQSQQQAQQQSQQQLQQQMTQQQQHQQLISTQNQNQIAQQHQAQLAQQFQRQEAFQQQLTNQQQSQSQQQSQLQQLNSQNTNQQVMNLTQVLPSEVKEVRSKRKQIEKELSEKSRKKVPEDELLQLKAELDANKKEEELFIEDAKKTLDRAKHPDDPKNTHDIDQLKQKVSQLSSKSDRSVMQRYLDDYEDRVKKDSKRYRVDPDTFGQFIDAYERLSNDLSSGSLQDSKYLKLFQNLMSNIPKRGKLIATRAKMINWLASANALYEKHDVGTAKSPFRPKTGEPGEKPSLWSRIGLSRPKVPNLPPPAPIIIPESTPYDHLPPPVHPTPAPKKESKKKGKKKKSEEYDTFPEDVDVDSGLDVLRLRRSGRRINEILREPIDPDSSVVTIHSPPPPPPPPSRPLFPPTPTPVSYATPKTSPILSTPWSVSGVMPSTGRPIPLPPAPKPVPKPKPAPKLTPTIIDIKPPTPISDVEEGSRRSRRSNSSVVRSDNDRVVSDSDRVVSEPPPSSSSSEEEEVPTVTRLQISRYKSKLNAQIRKGQSTNPRQTTLEKYGLVKDPTTGFYIEKRTGQGLKAGMAMPRLSEDRPKDIDRMLDLYGDWEITKLRAVRKPLNKIIERLANLVTLGRFEKKKKEIGVQVYYHLFMVIALRSPEGENNVIALEKNQRVGWKDHASAGLSSNEEGMDVPLGSKSVTLEEFIENGEDYNKSHQGETGCKMYIYSARGDGKQECNCQRYVEDMLKGNGLWSEKLKDFVIQDVQHTTPKLLGKLLDRVTNLASRANYMIRGGTFDMYRYKPTQQRIGAIIPVYDPNKKRISREEMLDRIKQKFGVKDNTTSN